MTSSPTTERAHAEARDLIPWWVNGRLTESEAQQVESHVAQCVECRADVEVERRVLAAVRRRSQVTYAPQVSLQKLMSRIEDVEREVPTRPAVDASRALARSAAESGSRWRLAAGVLLGLALGLAAAGGWRAASPGGTASYTTASVTQRPAGRPAQIRVVFSPTVTVEELIRVVAGNGLAIVDGPSESGVYGLATAARSEVSLPESLVRLRADPRVRFAEPVEGATSVTEP